MQEKTKNVLLAVLIVGLVSMTVAYAALSTTLTIKSSAKVAASKWDVEFTNLSSAQISNTQAGVTGTATVADGGAKIEGKTTIKGFDVTFKQPGDKVTYTFDIQNSGDINAQLNAYSKGTVTGSDDVVYDVVCGPAESQVAPVPKASMFNLDAKDGSTISKVSCTMSLTYKDTVTTMPATETTVTVGDTTFEFGQR